VGLYCGRTGIAYFFARLAVLFESDRYVELARTVMAPTIENMSTGEWFDVITGPAGAIPALLRLSSWIEIPKAVEFAITMGDRLLERAHRGPTGWWWNHGERWHSAGLTGFCHGAAGCGFGLLELYAVTREPKYRFAAEQAFAYEASLYNADLGNWPDLRDRDLQQVLADPTAEQRLRQHLQSGGRRARPQRSYMVAWCHGAGGIGLSRLRAFELLGDERYAEEARIAARTTALELSKGVGNTSLCHGVFGNCETLLRASKTLGDKTWLSTVQTSVAQAIASRRRRGDQWISGTLTGLPDPSLMQGDAGAGHFLLSLYSDEVSSVLLITAPVSQVHPTERERALIYAWQDTYVDQYFGRSIRAFERLQPELPTLRSIARSHCFRSELAAIYAEIVRRVRVELRPSTKCLLEDACAAEIARYESAIEFADFTDHLLETLARPLVAETCWKTSRFRLNRHTRLIQCLHEWDLWIQTETMAPPTAAQEPLWLLIFRDAQETRCKTLGPLAALVLTVLRESATWSEVNEAVIASISPNQSVDPLECSRLVLDQMKEMVARGIIEVDSPALCTI
jgi:hypothetical protein